jgi:polyhydroxyalkanoate synthesis regulator phasin
VRIGLIAQELKTVLPEVVKDWEWKVDEKTGERTKVEAERMGVMYSDIIPVLIKAIQEQEANAQKMREEIEILKREITKFEKKYNKN